MKLYRKYEILYQVKLLLLCVVVLNCSNLSYAKTLFYGSEVLTVPLSSDRPTILKFQAAVKTITGTKKLSVEPANKEAPNYSVLAVSPRATEGVSKVDFLLSDGSVVRGRFRIVSGSKADDVDSYYELKPKETYLGGDTTQPAQGSDLADMELMKALLKGDQVNGYEIKEVHRRVEPGFKGVETRLVKVYKGSLFNGYIYRLENKTDKKLFINVQNLSIGDPNLAILSSVDRSIIENRESNNRFTFLRIVAKPNSIFDQLTLPVQIAESKVN